MNKLSQPIESYIDSLTLSYSEAPYRFVERGTLAGSAEKLTKDNVEQSFLAEKSIVSFLAGVSAAHRNDILNTILLAQMAANNKVPDHETRMLDWYQAFMDILEKSTFYVLQAEQVTHFESSKSVFEMQSAILGLLQASFTGNVAAILEKTMESIGKLAGKDGRITAFDRNTHKAANGCFQIAAAAEENGVVSLQMGTFVISTTDKSTNILFIRTAKDETSLEYRSRQATFNAQGYTDTVRAKVEQILENRATQFLDKLF